MSKLANKQEQWLKNRQDFFSSERQTLSNYIDNMTSDLIDYSQMDNSIDTQNQYRIINVTVYDNRYIFNNIPNNRLKLDKGYIYLFNLNDTSNIGYQLVISRNAGTGQIQNSTYLGTPGNTGSLFTFYVGEHRPNVLYYYDKFHKGMGGKLYINN